MDKKRYYEIILEEDKKLQGAGGAVFVDVQYYAAVRFAEEYHKAEIAKAEYAKWEKSTEYKIDTKEDCAHSPNDNETLSLGGHCVIYCTKCGEVLTN